MFLWIIVGILALIAWTLATIILVLDWYGSTLRDRSQREVSVYLNGRPYYVVSWEKYRRLKRVRNTFERIKDEVELEADIL